MDNKYCKNCKNEFAPNTSNQVFCNKECMREYFRNKYMKQKQKLPIPKEKICCICDKVFTPKSINQVYCSKACRKESYKRRYPNKEKIISKKICKECENTFYDNTPAQNMLFCSKKCMTEHHSKKCKKEYYRKHSITKYKIFERDGFRCAYCGRISYKDEIELAVDHIKPQIKNGPHTINNLITSCKDCNSSKRDSELDQEIYTDIKKTIAERNKKYGYTGKEIMYF